MNWLNFHRSQEQQTARALCCVRSWATRGEPESKAFRACFLPKVEGLPSYNLKSGRGKETGPPLYNPTAPHTLQRGRDTSQWGPCQEGPLHRSGPQLAKDCGVGHTPEQGVAGEAVPTTAQELKPMEFSVPTWHLGLLHQDWCGEGSKPRPENVVLFPTRSL